MKSLFVVIAVLGLIFAMGAAFGADQVDQTGYVEITDATLVTDFPLSCGECIVQVDFVFNNETSFSAAADWIPGTRKYHASGLGEFLRLNEGPNRIEHRLVSNKGRKGPVSVWGLLMVPPEPPFIPPPASIESFNGVLPIEDDSFLR